ACCSAARAAGTCRDAAGAEPGGDRAAAAGEEGAAGQEDEARGGAAVEGGGEKREPGGQQGGQVREWHGRLLGRMSGGATLIVPRGPALVHPAAAPPGEAARRPSPNAEASRGK